VGEVETVVFKLLVLVVPVSSLAQFHYQKLQSVVSFGFAADYKMAYY
jgi:hypothetical protein